MATKKKTSIRTAKVAKTRSTGSARGAARKTAKKRNPQNIAIIALAAALVFMGIGFAAYATTLNIGGANNVTVKKAAWDIHWAGKSGASPAETGTVSVTKGSSLTNTISRAGETQVDFSVTLTKPGDEYEFTVDAVNAGTFDAGLTSVVLSDLSANSAYLTYTVTYGNQTFSGTTTTGGTVASNKVTYTPSPAITLTAGNQETVTVNVKYIQPANEASLPSSDVTVSATAAFNYDQVTN